MLKLEDQEFGRLKEFKCLGSTLTGNNITTEIKQRIEIEKQASYGLKKQLSS
jgi:hypothetical protein